MYICHYLFDKVCAQDIAQQLLHTVGNEKT